MLRHVLAAATLSACCASAHGAFTITNGNATFSTVLTPFLPDSALSTCDFRPDGGATTDHMFAYNWSYRAPIQGNRGFSFVDTPVQTIAGDTVILTYTNAGPGVVGQNRFNATLTIRITDGPVPGAARVLSTLTFTAAATNTGPVTFDIFHVDDFDVGGTATGDTYTIANPAGVSGTAIDGTNTMRFVGLNAPRFEVGSGTTLRNKIIGGLNQNLSNAAGPFTGDGAVGYQWTFTNLAPGQSVSVATAFGLNVPALPCPADIDGNGAIDTADLVILLGNFGTPVPPGTGGDINGDGFVDTADLVVLLGVFGTVCP